MRSSQWGSALLFLLVTVFLSACQSSSSGREPALNQASSLKALEEAQQGLASLHEILATGNSHWTYFHDTAITRNVQIMAHDSSFQERYHTVRGDWETQTGVSQQALLKWQLLLQEQAQQLRPNDWTFSDKDRMLFEQQARHLKATAMEELAALSEQSTQILALKAHLDTLPIPKIPILPVLIPPPPQPIPSPA